MAENQKIEYSQLGYDLVKMRQWETALPVLELVQATGADL